MVRVCARRLLLIWDCGTVSLLHASAVGCANSGSTVGLCSDLPVVVQVSIFLHAVVGMHASPRFSAVDALSPSQQIPGARSTADPQAARQVASTQASTSKNVSWWLCWLAKLSCGSLRPVGRTPKQLCEDPLADLWGGVNLRQT